MKKLLTLSFLSLFLFSCSGDDDGTTGSSDNNDYFPNSPTAAWHYDYNQTNQGVPNAGNVISDIAANTTVNGETYNVLNNTTFVIGAMDQILFNKNSNNELTIRPVISMLDYSFDFDNMKLIANNMQANGVVQETEKIVVGDAMQIPANTTNITGTVIPTIHLTIRNRHIDKQNSMSVLGMDYANTTHQRLEYDIKMILNIDATVELGGQVIPVNRDHELIAQQQYGELDLYFAKDVGIIKTNYDYSFEDITLQTSIDLGGFSVDIVDLAPEILEINNTLNVQGNAQLTDYTL